MFESCSANSVRLCGISGFHRRPSRSSLAHGGRHARRAQKLDPRKCHFPHVLFLPAQKLCFLKKIKFYLTSLNTYSSVSVSLWIHTSLFILRPSSRSGGCQIHTVPCNLGARNSILLILNCTMTSICWSPLTCWTRFFIV